MRPKMRSVFYEECDPFSFAILKKEREGRRKKEVPHHRGRKDEEREACLSGRRRCLPEALSFAIKHKRGDERNVERSEEGIDERAFWSYPRYNTCELTKDADKRGAGASCWRPPKTKNYLCTCSCARRAIVWAQEFAQRRTKCT